MTYILIPIIGALIGWITNLIAVKMLFHPRRPINCGLFTIQGVFPKRQQKLAVKLGSVVSTELISIVEIQEKIKDSANSKEILKIVEDRLERFIQHKLPIIFPLVAMVLNAQLVQTIKEQILAEFNPLVDDLVAKLTNNLGQSLDVHKIVEEKVANFSSDKLEEILISIMKKEFKFIELVGGILGFLIGCLQLLVANNSEWLETHFYSFFMK